MIQEAAPHPISDACSFNPFKSQKNTQTIPF